MSSAVREPRDPYGPAGKTDQRVFLHGVSWEDFERLLAIRGESSGARMTYLRGELELMSPSIGHEGLKTWIARLVEAWAEERNVDLDGYGSWTVKEAAEERGIEPDEWYVVGSHQPDRPDVAIEVIRTRGGLDELEVYRGLGVREVWLWRDGVIEVHGLRGDRYERLRRSEVVPELDLQALTGFLDRPSQTRAVRAWRGWLRGESDPTDGT